MEQGNATLEKSGKIYSPEKEVWNIPEALRLSLNGQEWAFFSSIL